MPYKNGMYPIQHHTYNVDICTETFTYKHNILSGCKRGETEQLSKLIESTIWAM